MSATKPDGVYMMDVATGIETYLAPAPWYASPVFARDGSSEVYYYYGRLEVRAVNTVTYVVRTIVSLSGTSWQEKIEVNADGSYISAHPQISESFRTVIFTPQGQVHQNWTLSGQGRDDGAVWHPTDPKWICAYRGSQAKIWHIDTLATKAGACETAHSSWHANGQWMITQGFLWDIETGASVMSGGGMYPYHPNINPAQASLGLDAQIAVDDRRWDSIPGRPRLYLPTIRRLLTISNSIWASNDGSLAAVHYSSMANNYAHAHAHWSWDGQYVLWTSDVADLRDGSPPGGTGGGTDLFIFPVGAGSSSSSSTPTLSVSPTSLSFTAVQGGAAPAAQSLSIGNTGGGTLTWTISDNAAWLSTSITGGTGNATVNVTAAPTGLAAGTYTGTITVSASGASGSPRTMAVTFTVTQSLPQTQSLTLTALTASRTAPQSVGTAITFTATATGGTAPYQHKWWVYDGTTWTVVQNWTTSSTYTWTPTA
ncbi:MAG TPA: BACON domain-containing protein, partial [Methylomirabilota bacterium]|nr:BACON domain-containing protein [Methylomirabilota bacterium]